MLSKVPDLKQELKSALNEVVKLCGEVEALRNGTLDLATHKQTICEYLASLRSADGLDAAFLGCNGVRATGDWPAVCARAQTRMRKPASL